MRDYCVLCGRHCRRSYTVPVASCASECATRLHTRSNTLPQTRYCLTQSARRQLHHGGGGTGGGGGGRRSARRSPVPTSRSTPSSGARSTAKHGRCFGACTALAFGATFSSVARMQFADNGDPGIRMGFDCGVAHAASVAALGERTDSTAPGSGGETGGGCLLLGSGGCGNGARLPPGSGGG